MILPVIIPPMEHTYPAKTKWHSVQEVCNASEGLDAIQAHGLFGPQEEVQENQTACFAKAE
jgi:hypothetical protein